MGHTFKRTRLDWHRSSWKHTNAKVGPLSLETTKITGLVDRYTVGEVFGSRWNDNGILYETVYDAQIAAEAVAERLLKQAAKAWAKMKKRG